MGWLSTTTPKPLTRATPKGRTKQKNLSKVYSWCSAELRGRGGGGGEGVPGLGLPFANGGPSLYLSGSILGSLLYGNCQTLLAGGLRAYLNKPQAKMTVEGQSRREAFNGPENTSLLSTPLYTYIYIYMSCCIYIYIYVP